MADTQAQLTEAAYGRYPYHPVVRWCWTAFAVGWAGIGVVQLVRGLWPWYLLVAAGLTVLAVGNWLAVLVVSEAGVRWLRGGVVPWSEVQPFVAPPHDGWTHDSALVLKDGTSKPLPKMNYSQLESLARLSRQKRATVE